MHLDVPHGKSIFVQTLSAKDIKLEATPGGLVAKFVVKFYPDASCHDQK